MKTLSVSEARSNLTHCLDQVAAGKSIGILFKGKVYKLQPVAVTEDYAATEYGIEPEEMDRIAAAMQKDLDEQIARGETMSFEEFKRQLKQHEA